MVRGFSSDGGSDSSPLDPSASGLAVVREAGRANIEHFLPTKPPWKVIWIIFGITGVSKVIWMYWGSPYDTHCSHFRKVTFDRAHLLGSPASLLTAVCQVFLSDGLVQSRTDSACLVKSRLPPQKISQLTWSWNLLKGDVLYHPSVTQVDLAFKSFFLQRKRRKIQPLRCAQPKMSICSHDYFCRFAFVSRFSSSLL